MKSKMKSAFAIIAVALMIMVAVVPMVGVFTGSSDAAIPVNGDPDIDDGIVITGYVYNIDGSHVSGKVVKIVYGDDGVYSETGTTDANGLYTINVKDTIATKATVFVTKTVNGVEIEDDEYGEVDFTKQTLVMNNTYVANFRCGYTHNTQAIPLYSTGTTKFVSNGNTAIYNTNAFYAIFVNYTLYKSLDDDGKGQDEIVSSFASLDKTNSNFTVMYEGTYDDVYVQITSIDVKLTSTSEKYNVPVTTNIDKIDEDVALVWEQRIFNFVVDNVDFPSATFSMTNGKYTTDDGTATVTKFTYMDGTASDAIAKKGETLRFAYKADAAITTFSATVTWTPSGTATTKEVKETLTDVTIADYKYQPAGFFGTFQMSDGNTSIDSYFNQSLTMKYVTAFNTDGTPKTTVAISKIWVANGCYVALYDGEAACLYVEMSGFTDCEATIQNQPIDDKHYTPYDSEDKYIDPTNQADIEVDSTGFILVSGEIFDAADESEAPDVVVSVVFSGFSTATSVFGYPVTTKDKVNSLTVTTTADDNAYAFFVKKYEEITVAPAANEKFEINQGGPYLLVEDVDLDITMVKKYMYFTAIDGNLDAIYEDLTLNFPITSTLYFIFGESTIAEFDAYDATENPLGKNMYKVEVDKPYYDINGGKFYVTSENYTYASSETSLISYSEGMIVLALDTTYSFYLKDNNGNVVSVVDDDLEVIELFEAYVVPVHVSEGLSYIFGEGTEVTIAPGDATGEMKVTVPSTYVNVEIKAYDKYALVIVPVDEEELSAEDYFVLKDYYFFDATRTAPLIITADADEFSGFLMQANGDGIIGAYVAIEDGAETYVATTGLDGGFTVNAAYPLTEDAVISFEKYGYAFEDEESIYDDTTGERKVLFESVADPYYIILEDKDKGKFILDEDDIFNLTDGNIVSISELTNTIMVTAHLEVGMIVTPTLFGLRDVSGIHAYATDDDNPIPVPLRTFEPYTITADDFEDGIITLPTNESTYTITVQDSVGTNVSVNYYGIVVGAEVPGLSGYYERFTPVYHPEDEQEEETIPAYYEAYIGAIATTTTTGVYKVVLSSDSYVIGCGDYNGGYFISEKNGNYLFSLLPEVVSGASITLKSLYTKISFAIQDAAGASLPISGIATLNAAVKDADDIYADHPTITKVESLNQAYFFGDATATYKPTGQWTVNVGEDDYKIASKAKITSGVLKTTEQKVIFTVKDKLSNPIVFGETGATLTAYVDDGTTKVIGNEYKTDADGTFYEVFEKKATYTYGLVDNAENAVYTFALTKDTNFVADQSTLTPVAMTANGLDITYVLGDVKAYAADGNKIGKFTEDGKFIVDTSAVSYYVATSNADTFTFPDRSETVIFVANESMITGSVPFSGDDTKVQTMDIFLCLGENVVGGFTLDDEDEGHGFITDYQYTMIIDLSDYVSGTAGVPFDSIVANYYEEGVLIASGNIDPLSTINNIYTPEQQAAARYNVIDQTSGPGALYSQAYVVNNNLLVLSATPVFYISDEGYYVDGQYKYVFAGWFVDGVKVSANADFAMNIEADVVVAAQYDVTYEKISDANKDVEKEYVNIVEKVEVPVEKTVGIDTNVLIIGICAVIVALIAVVYAVIKKE